MSTLGDLLRARSSVVAPAPVIIPASTRPAATFTYWQSRPAVGNSADLQRILALPVQEPPPDNLIGVMTAKYARKGGTMTLKDIQAKALHQIEREKGLVGPVGVGFG